MDEQGYMDYIESLSHRNKKLDNYECFVKNRLEDYPDATSAQVKDWLMEYHPDLKNLCDKTVYNFVVFVRHKYAIPKTFDSRVYHKVEELPYGKQAQADFGEFNITDIEGHRKKVYFFALVLARSRYKYTYFQDHPFTTEETCIAHDNAFSFIGGYPQEMVYDQDKRLLTDENAGNLLLTNVFALYTRDKPFKLHFCRKSDPQSKGKIENVVRYVKYNFLRGRRYDNIHVLNSQACEWLERTANAKVHSATGLVPSIEWQAERSSLQPVTRLYEPAPERPAYHVRKDNTITYKGTYYVLPPGTFKGDSTIVRVEQQENELVIYDCDMTLITRHPLSLIKGATVGNSSHYRDTSTTITDKIKLIARYFTDPEKATLYLERLREMMPRYARDQLIIIEKQCIAHTRENLDSALDYCLENNIPMASDFKHVLTSISQPESTANLPQDKPLVNNRPKIIPMKSDISDYKQILEN
jgi:hypothetical protein